VSFPEAFLAPNVGFSGEFEDVVDRFTPDAGPDITRRKAGAISQVWTFSRVASTEAVNDLVDFFVAPEGGNAGDAEFDFPHPRRQSVTVAAKFLGPPAVRFLGNDAWQVDFVLRVKPGPVEDL
jgi:hypothetical protein